MPIIGGGPAGMSCALWLHNYGLAPIIIEREEALGGIARASAYPNDWLLGRAGESGRDNAAAFARHIHQVGVPTMLGARPQRLRCDAGGMFTLDIATAALPDRPPLMPEEEKEARGRTQSLSAPALVIATGTRFAGEEWLQRVRNARALAAGGRVHLGAICAGDPGADLGSRVAVIGGGDNAFDVSRMLVERGIKITLVMRSASPRARPALVERLRPYEASGAATVIASATVHALDRAGDHLRIDFNGGCSIEVDHVLVLFGYMPNTDQPWLLELGLKRQPGGYLAVDGNMETSHCRVFAVGDVADPAHPCVATAVATGTVAAREIQRRLCAGL